MSRGARLNGRPPGTAIHPLLALAWLCVLVVSAEVDISQGEFPDVDEAVMLPEKAHLVRRASSRDVSWDPSDPMPEVTELLQEEEVVLGEGSPIDIENEKDKVAAAQAKADEEKKELGEQQQQAQGIALLKEQNDAKAVEKEEGQQLEQKEKFEAVAAEKAAAAKELEEKAEQDDQKAVEKKEKQKEIGQKKAKQDEELRKAEGNEEVNKFSLHEKKEKTKKTAEETEEKEKCQKRSFQESEEKAEAATITFEKEQDVEEEKRTKIKVADAQNRMKADKEEIEREEQENKDKAAEDKAAQDAETERKKAEAKKEAEEEEAEFEAKADQQSDTTNPAFPTNSTEAEAQAEKLGEEEEAAKKKELEDITTKEIKEKADEKADEDREVQETKLAEEEKKAAEEKEEQEEKAEKERKDAEEEDDEKFQEKMKQRALESEKQMKSTQKEDEKEYKLKCKEEKEKADVLEKDKKEADNKQLKALESKGEETLNEVKVKAKQRLDKWTIANNTKAAKQRKMGDAPVDETLADMDEEAFTSEEGAVGQLVEKVPMMKPNMTLPKTKKENDTVAAVNLTTSTEAPDSTAPTTAPTAAPTAPAEQPKDATLEPMEDDAFKNDADNKPPGVNKETKQMTKKATKSFDTEEPDKDGWSKQNISAGTNGSNMTNNTHRQEVKKNTTKANPPNATTAPTPTPTPAPTMAAPTPPPTEGDEEDPEKCDAACRDRMMMASVNKDMAEEDKVQKQTEQLVDNEIAAAAESDYNETATVLMEAVKKAAAVQKLLDDPDLTPVKKAELEAQLAEAKAVATKAEVIEVDKRAQIVKANKQIIETVNVVRMAEAALNSANITLENVKEHTAKLLNGTNESEAGPSPAVPGAAPPIAQPTAQPTIAPTATPTTAAPTPPPTPPPPTAAPTPAPTVSDSQVSNAIAAMGKLPANYKKDYNCENKWALEHCEELGEHCATSMTMRMKCPKVCGSCKEQFPLPEPKDHDKPEEKPKVEYKFELREARNIRDAQEDLRDTERDVDNDNGDANDYMKEASNVYDSFFVTSPVDREASSPVSLSAESDAALFESINSHVDAAELEAVREVA